MSQEIGPVTVCHGMSLVVTPTKDCASPLKAAARQRTDVSPATHDSFAEIPVRIMTYLDDTIPGPQGCRTPD